MSFLHPSLLWLSLLAVPLVVLYVLKAGRTAHRVPATWLWRQALHDVEARVPFRRLRRDWLLLLELLALALLVLAAAGPTRRTLPVAGRRVALVLDASAAMSAEGRLDEARREAARFVGGMGSGSEALLVRAASRPAVVAALASDRAALRSALAGVRASSAPARLGPALALARSLVGPTGSVVLFTAGARDVPDTAGLSVVRVGRPMENVGIVAFGVRPRDASGADHEAFARLRNASAVPATGTLRLLVDGGLRNASTLAIPADGEVARTLDLPGVVEGVVEAVWDGETKDPFPVDDRAAWVLRAPSPRTFRLVGAPGPELLRALAANDDWRAVPADITAARADVDVVVGGAPAADGPPMLLVNPPAGTFGAAAGGAAAGVSILHWDATHPALRFVPLASVRLGRVPRIARPAGARVLAESAAGPLILEGTLGSRRYLLWAFDPAESDLPLRVAFPLLVRNALELLAPTEGNLPGGLPTGVVREVPWPADGPAGKPDGVELVTPSGERIPLAAAGGVLSLPPLEEVGVHEVAGGGRRVRFAASLLNREESDLRLPVTARRAARSGPGFPPGPAVVKETRPGSGGEAGRLLAFAAIVLLLLDAAAFHLRWEP